MDHAMNYQNILSKEFKDLNSFAKQQKRNYISAHPFPHITITNFFGDNFLNEILNEFPDLSKLNATQNYNNKNEIKFANNVYDNFSDKMKFFFNFLNSDTFLSFLQSITSIKEKLVSDSHLNGGGLHEIRRGGVLKIHTDFNRHPTLNLDRRVNVLIFLNKNWDESYGGHLELWDKNMKVCGKKILPSFNTMTIFSTTDYSNHGHPNPLNCPSNLSRKSIATYYFSKGRPESEILNKYMKNRTFFKNRFGIKDDVYEKKQLLKNILRKFHFYHYLKKIEKKYFRTGKSEEKQFKNKDFE